MKVNIQVKGIVPAEQRLASMGNRVKDGRPVFKAVVYNLLLSERRRFQTRGNGRSPKLDPATIRAKARKGQSPAVLEAAGGLKRALTQAHAPRPDSAHSQPGELRFGLEPRGVAYYGKFHQKGAGVPKRTLFSVTPTQRAVIRGKLRAYLVHGTVYTHGATRPASPRPEDSRDRDRHRRRWRRHRAGRPGGPPDLDGRRTSSPQNDARE